MESSSIQTVKLALYLILPVFLVQLVTIVVSVILLRMLKKHLTIEPAGQPSPFLKVYKVLKYAWQHKCPERRSAFTYWEEDIPPRIDLGKSKYGGPFTTEEVEDVKTFISLFFLLLSLFGFHLADNGYSTMRELYYKLCPSVIVFSIITISPNVIYVHAVTAVLCVPLFHFFILPCFDRSVPKMLHQIGIGCMFIFFQELAGSVIILSSLEEYCKCPYVYIKAVVSISSSIADCFYQNLKDTNITHKSTTMCGGERIFLWLLVPIVACTLAYHLVFLTALKSISAQAPLKMKGPLISFWYALSAQRYLVQGFTISFVLEDRVWLAVHGVKAFLILVSVLLYCCVAKCYRYQLRDEVVNERHLVEEVYDRELNFAE